MNAPVTKFIEIPKGHLFTPEEAARRKMWAQYFVGIFTGVARAHGYGLFAGGSMVRDIDLVAVPWRQPLPEKHPDSFVLQLVHDLGLTMGNRGTTLYGHRWYALWDQNHPDQQIDLKVIMPAKFLRTEDDCPGHACADPKICCHCGTHIDSLRPSEPDDF